MAAISSSTFRPPASGRGLSRAVLGIGVLILAGTAGCRPPSGTGVAYVERRATATTATLAIAIRQDPAPGRYRAQYLSMLDWEQATATLTNTTPVTNLSQSATASVAAGARRTASLVFPTVVPATGYTLTIALKRTNAAGSLVTVASGSTTFTISPGPNSVNVPVTLDPTNGTLSVAIPEPSLTPVVSANIATFAGTGTAGGTGDGGLATAAKLSSPYGVGLDARGNVYIADQQNHSVRMVDLAGIISTLAGTGAAGFAGDGGLGTGAQFDLTYDCAVDAAGNTYVADFNNHRIRKIDAAGMVSTYAGTGTAGALGDGGLATAAQLSSPGGVAVDAAGNLYIADRGNHKIRKVDASGVITTYAGTGTAGPSGDGGAATAAQLSNPTGVAISSAGVLYIADTSNEEIRMVTAGGVITRFAGTGASGYSGDGGLAKSATLTTPTRVSLDAAGNLYIADAGNHRIRKVDGSGIITTYAGIGTSGSAGDGASATGAQLFSPTGVAMDPAGNLYIADRDNHKIRRVGQTPLLGWLGPAGAQAGATIVLNGRDFSTTPASNTVTFNGAAATVTAATTSQLTVTVPAATSGAVTVAVGGLTSNSQSFTVSPGTIAAFAGDGTVGSGGDGGPATAAQFRFCEGMAADAFGNIYLSDYGAHVVRKVDSGGTITRVAGTIDTSGFSGDGGPATSAKLNQPMSLAVDAAGNLYIADGGNFRIRKVDRSGVITTVAGTGTYGNTGNGGLATAAQIANPDGLACDPSGNLYMTDYYGLVVRKITPAGIISVFAGSGAYGSSGDGGLATAAAFGSPKGMAADGLGNVYISDLDNGTVRKVNTSGIITAWAGIAGSFGAAGDGGSGAAATLSTPRGLAADAAGNLYIADQGANRIRRVSPSGTITTIAGTGATGSTGDGGLATSAAIGGPLCTMIDGGGHLYVSSGSLVRRVF